jgi:4-carboxymuconolactone decarboxylase
MKEQTMDDPRLAVPLRTSADTEGDVQRVLAQMEESGVALKVIRVVANAPAAFRPFVLFAKALMVQGYLAAEEREVVVLHLAQRGGLPYEWEEHVPIARSVGLTDEQIDALEAGTTTGPLFSEGQALALRFAGAVADGDELTDELWDAARDRWGVEGAMDLVLAVGWWGGLVATVVRAFGLRSPKV